MDGLTFKGIHSSTFGLVADFEEFDILPEPKKIEIEVPGKNSVIDYTDGTLEDMEFKVTFKFKEKNKAITMGKIEQIAQWLHTPLNAREPLIFDFYPGRTYQAKVNNRVKLTTQLRSLRQFTVVFKATPPSYLDI